MSKKRQFEVQDMLRDLDGGTLLDQISASVHESAKTVVLHGNGKRKGKVVLELNISQIAQGASQVMIGHKLVATTLTSRGNTVETRINESPMHVTKTGVSSTPEGQLDFLQEEEVRKEQQHD